MDEHFLKEFFSATTKFKKQLDEEPDRSDFYARKICNLITTLADVSYSIQVIKWVGPLISLKMAKDVLKYHHICGVDTADAFSVNMGIWSISFLLAQISQTSILIPKSTKSFQL